MQASKPYAQSQGYHRFGKRGLGYAVPPRNASCVVFFAALPQKIPHEASPEVQIAARSGKKLFASCVWGSAGKQASRQKREQEREENLL